MYRISNTNGEKGKAYWVDKPVCHARLMKEPQLSVHKRSLQNAGKSI